MGLIHFVRQKVPAFDNLHLHSVVASPKFGGWTPRFSMRSKVGENFFGGPAPVSRLTYGSVLVPGTALAAASSTLGKN
jgi:hypothetical protein